MSAKKYPKRKKLASVLPVAARFSLAASTPKPIFDDLESAGPPVTDALDFPEGTRERVIASLAAARALFLNIREIAPRAGTSATNALAELSHDLLAAEVALRGLELGCPPEPLLLPAKGPGRKLPRYSVLRFQACCVAAVRWLQSLDKYPMNQKDALKEVAAYIPSQLCGKHPTRSGSNRSGRLSPREQLGEWRNEFNRVNTPRNNLVRDIWYSLEADWRLHKPAGKMQAAHPNEIYQWLNEAIPNA